jgi:hypothetical protein
LKEEDKKLLNIIQNMQLFFQRAQEEKAVEELVLDCKGCLPTIWMKENRKIVK